MAQCVSHGLQQLRGAVDMILDIGFNLDPVAVPLHGLTKGSRDLVSVLLKRLLEQCEGEGLQGAASPASGWPCDFFSLAFTGSLRLDNGRSFHNHCCLRSPPPASSITIWWVKVSNAQCRFRGERKQPDSKGVGSPSG